MHRRSLLALALFALFAQLPACGRPPESASKNRTFYDLSSNRVGQNLSGLELRYPPLDAPAFPPQPEFVGVTTLRGGIHLSRPIGWTIRQGGDEPERAFIQYLSPNGYLVSFYDRMDAPGDSWRDIQAHFEDDATAVGAKIVGGKIPLAFMRGQGRLYLVDRRVNATRAPFITHAHEILGRGEHRVVLVQIVYQAENLRPFDQDLLRVLQTLEIL